MFKLGIKCTVVELDLFYDGVAFDIVMGIYEVEVKYFQLFDLKRATMSH